MNLQLTGYQVDQLIGAVVGAFEGGGEPAVAIDDAGGGIVSDGAFVGPVDFAEGGGERRDIAREKVPGGASRPAAGVIGEDGGGGVIGVDGDGEEGDVGAEGALG